MSKKFIFLLSGDVLTLFIVTLVGFATHGELQEAGLRILTTFIPLVISWFIVAPVSGAYKIEIALNIRHLWKPVWSMLLAVSLAVLLRGGWLNRPVLPLFSLVLAGSCALGILIWRSLFLAFFRTKP